MDFSASHEQRSICISFVVSDVHDRPAQLAELPHSEFGPELFPNSAYVKLFCDICDKKAVLNIL